MGRFMKALRKEKGLTQEELAERLYVSSKTVSRWETGHTLPDLSMLQNIADFYGIDLKELINAEKNTEGTAEKETLKDLSAYSEEKEKKKLRRIVWGLGIALAGLAAFVLFLVFFKRKDSPPSPETNVQKDLEAVREGYSAAEAEYDGCIVISDNALVHGEVLWNQFLQDTRNARAASVRLYLDVGKMTGRDYLVKDLSFDGSRYALSWYERINDAVNWTFAQQFASMLKEETLTDYNHRVCYYYLTDDPDASMADVFSDTFHTVYRGLPARSQDLELLFQWDLSEDPLPVLVSDIQDADLDGDGIPERCFLGPGRTSGIFTFELYVYGRDTGLIVKKTFRKKDYGYLTLHLVRRDGKLCVEGSTIQDKPLKEYFWPILLQGNDLRLEDEYDVLETAPNLP